MKKTQNSVVPKSLAESRRIRSSEPLCGARRRDATSEMMLLHKQTARPRCHTVRFDRDPRKEPAHDPTRSKNCNQSQLLTCAANEQQPPDEVLCLQHNVSQIFSWRNRRTLNRQRRLQRWGGRRRKAAFQRDNSKLPSTDFWSLSLPVFAAQ